MGSSSGGIQCSNKFIKCCLSFGLILLVSAIVSHGHTGDSCDWNGSGMSSSDIPSTVGKRPERGVQPLYLRCSQGRIRWSYPAGALHLVLRLQQGGEFRACLRPAENFQGARIYLEGHRRLHLLYGNANDDVHQNDVTSDVKMRCFASVHGQAALYVEALPDNLLLRKTVAEFAYDLQPLGKDDLADDMQECRPCTEEEVIQYYCSSDYVIRGVVSSLWHDPTQQRSELSVRVTRVHRDSATTPVLGPGRHDPDDSYALRATLHRPLKCGTKAGSGEFLFLGRRLLGVPYVTCAPRLAEWKAVRRKAIKDGSNPCELD